MNFKPKMIYLAIVGLVIVLLGGFYWYELRPAKIRHDCSWIQDPSDETHWDPVFYPSRSKFYNERYSGYYDFCIKEKGLAR